MEVEINDGEVLNTIVQTVTPVKDVILIMPDEGEVFTQERVAQISEYLEETSNMTGVNFVILDRRVFKLTQEMIDTMQKWLDTSEELFNAGNVFGNTERDNKVHEFDAELP